MIERETEIKGTFIAEDMTSVCCALKATGSAEDFFFLYCETFSLLPIEIHILTHGMCAMSYHILNG